VGDLSIEYLLFKINKLKLNFASNNNSNYTCNVILSHFFSNRNADKRKGYKLSSIHLKYQEQNINKYNPFSAINMLNSSYEKDEIERNFSLLFKGHSKDNKKYLELQNDHYIGTTGNYNGKESLTGNRFRILLVTKIDKKNELKFSTTLKNENQLVTTEDNKTNYIEAYEKKFELKHKFKIKTNKLKKENKLDITAMSILQYKDENDGFGYLFSENITLSYNISKKNESFSFLRKIKNKN